MRLLPMLVGVLMSFMIFSATGTDRSKQLSYKEIPEYIISKHSGNIIRTTLHVDKKVPYAFCFAIDTANIALSCYTKVDQRFFTAEDGTQRLQELFIIETIDMKAKDGT